MAGKKRGGCKYCGRDVREGYVYCDELCRELDERRRKTAKRADPFHAFILAQRAAKAQGKVLSYGRWMAARADGKTDDAADGIRETREGRGWRRLRCDMCRHFVLSESREQCRCAKKPFVTDRFGLETERVLYIYPWSPACRTWFEAAPERVDGKQDGRGRRRCGACRHLQEAGDGAGYRCEIKPFLPDRGDGHAPAEFRPTKGTFGCKDFEADS